MDPVIDLLTSGLARLRERRYGEAAAACQEVLARAPEHPDALHLLGVLSFETGDPRRAVELIERAIARHGSCAQYHNNLGNALEASGQGERALAAYESALRLDGESVEARVNLGNLLLRRGHSDEAVAQCRVALARHPRCAEAWQALGNAWRRKGSIEAATECFRRALSARPAYPEALVGLAAALRDGAEAQGDPPDIRERKLAEAEADCREAIRLAPLLAEAHFALGLTLRDLGRRDEALEALRQAVRLKPDLYEGQTALVQLYFGLRRYEDAEQCCRAALAVRSDALRYFNLGSVLTKLARQEEAETALREAVRLDPASAEARRTLGNALFAQKRFDEAEAAYRTALALDPQDSGTHWNRALLLLLTGRFEEGWREYEWRWKLPGVQPRQFEQPRWDGSPLQGRTLLVYAEQGLGDTLQFSRYLPRLRGREGHVVLECQTRVAPVLAGFEGIDVVVGSGAPLPDFDVQFPLLSLPGLFGTTRDSVPGTCPYLKPDPGRTETWRARLACEDGFRVGLAWAGNPNHPNDRQRSVALHRIAPLLRTPGVRFYGLQLGPEAAQVQELPGELRMPLLPQADLPETAAILQNLDLVITVDTMLAHLAGALGVPVWTLLPYLPDWRWGLDQTGTAWYPTMRLFRQERPGDWEAVIEQAAEALHNRVHP